MNWFNMRNIKITPIRSNAVQHRRWMEREREEHLWDDVKRDKKLLFVLSGCSGMEQTEKNQRGQLCNLV